VLLLSTIALAEGPTAGETLFRAKCTICHSLTSGMSTFAPDLHGVVGRKVASLPNFKYTLAMQDLDFVWTPEKLDEWLASPHRVADTDMTFPGLKDAKDRADLIE
jgi:cytochrome c2